LYYELIHVDVMRDHVNGDGLMSVTDPWVGLTDAAVLCWTVFSDKSNIFFTPFEQRVQPTQISGHYYINE
jgi:hypothetical protein